MHIKQKIYIIKILDIDECAIDNGGCTSIATDNSSCTVMCSNTQGSFQCICIDGYTLDTDMQTCVGKLEFKINVAFW